MIFEEYLALVEQDPEHACEYLDGRVYMMTGGSPDHSIIGSNLNGLLQTFPRGRRCIVYNSDVYVQLSEQYHLSLSLDKQRHLTYSSLRRKCSATSICSKNITSSWTRHSKSSSSPTPG